MVFDAHDRAFAFFKGACGRGVYDNMKTAVETIFIGKDRQYNRRFLQMGSHSPRRAGRLHAGVRLGEAARSRTRSGSCASASSRRGCCSRGYNELNAWLLDKCIAWAKAHAHPERPDRTIFEVFEEERPKLIPYRGRFDGFHAACRPRCRKLAWSGSTTTGYSVSASAVSRPVEVHAYADRLVIRQDGRIVAEHPLLLRAYGATAIRSLAIRAGSGSQAGRSAQRRLVQGLGAADGPGPRAAQAGPGPTTATGRW